MRELLRREYGNWQQDPGYLHCPPTYDVTCPPLLSIGWPSASNEDGGPLVLISLEPLLTGHFQAQRAYVAPPGGSYDSYERWNVEYFRVAASRTVGDPYHAPGFSGLAPQGYWQAIHELVAGFSGQPQGVFSWDTLEANLLELPLVPMHAPNNDPMAWAQGVMALHWLLAERLQIVLARWPRARFLALGAAVRTALAPNLHNAPTLDLGPLAGLGGTARDPYGNQLWNRPVQMVSVAIPATQTHIEVAFRAAFSSGHSPTRLGIYELGRAIARWQWS